MDLGAEALVAIDPVTGEVRTLFRDGTVSSVSALPDGRLVFARSNFTSPADLYTIGPGGKTSTRITQVNRDRMDGVELGTYEQFSFAGWNNETVYGYVVRPAGFDPARKYPVALLVHGGPQDSWVDEFHYRWNPQVYAARGYAVVLIDVHGSIGYGQAFTDSIRGDWGGKPLTDLQKGLDAALLRYPWMDGDRVSALGASYGGYMVNWMAGVWPDRFRCLVNHNGEFDSRSEYYSTDELWFDEWERRGTPWENPAGYSLHNPADHVAAWRTPMLVVQCGRDYRVPEGNGLSTFTALQRRGVPSELLYFPDESHWVTRPENSLLWHRTVLDWLDRWNTVPANAVAAAPVQLPAVFQRDAVSLP
jgi:dipeptidyl aminopeptidase/acylaminoacyl peptidase